MKNFEKKLPSQVGKQAEQAACEYLKKQGLKLVKCNYRSHFGEIDLVMRDNEYLIFIEVRMRNHQKFASPSESVTIQKQTKIKKTAIIYLQQQKLLDKIPCRFDVIAIEKDRNDYYKFCWIKNAF